MSFSVVWMAHCSDKLSAFAFSSTTGQWRAIHFISELERFASWLAMAERNGSLLLAAVRLWVLLLGDRLEGIVAGA
jgi:hypothetical protein